LENNIKIGLNLVEIGREVANCFKLAHDRFQWQGLVNTIMNLRIRIIMEFLNELFKYGLNN
jgi:hypothetical protein